MEVYKINFWDYTLRKGRGVRNLHYIYILEEDIDKVEEREVLEDMEQEESEIMLPL